MQFWPSVQSQCWSMQMSGVGEVTTAFFLQRYVFADLLPAVGLFAAGVPSTLSL